MKAQKLLHFLRGTYWPQKILCLALYKKSYQVSVTSPVKLLYSSSNSEKVISTEDLREYFECPICFNVPRSPPIYACGVGHMICRVCRPKLKNCPTCRMPYPPPGTQNHRYEPRTKTSFRSSWFFWLLLFNSAFDSRCFMIFFPIFRLYFAEKLLEERIPIAW